MAESIRGVVRDPPHAQPPRLRERRSRLAGPARALRRGRAYLSAPLAPVAVALCLYLLIGYSNGQPYRVAGDPGTFVHPGTAFGAPASLLPHGVILYPGTGFDGQFSFYIAENPLLPASVERHLDQPAYRYQRILLPVLGWFTSFGDPDALKWSLPIINLLAILISGYMLAVFLRRHGRSTWWSMAYMLNIGLAVALVNDVPDPLATGLVVSGTLLWLDRRRAPAIALLSLSVFARETSLVAVALIAVVELVRDRRRAGPWLIPAFLGVAWQLYIALRFSVDQFQGTAKPRGVPLVGAVDKLSSVLHSNITGAANWEAMLVLLLVAASLSAVVFGAQALWRVLVLRPRPPRLRWRSGAQLDEVAPLPGAGYGVLVILLSSALWRDPLSYPRYGAPLAAFLLLAYAISARRLGAALATALAAMTFANPLFGVLPVDFGPVLAAPGVGSSSGSTLSTGPSGAPTAPKRLLP